MVDETEVTPPDPWIRTMSPEQSIHLCKTSFYPHRLRLLGPPHNFGLTHRVTRVGPLTSRNVATDPSGTMPPTLLRVRSSEMFRAVRLNCESACAVTRYVRPR